MRRLTLLFVPVALVFGCSLENLRTPERQEQGLVLILPGIEGPSMLNQNLARGLADGGVKNAIEIFDWGTTVPGGLLFNLVDYERNQRQAERLCQRIRDERRAHPNRAIHLVGHSGGAGVAVLAVERLPADAEVTSLILLAPAISPEHDLRAALRRSRYGVFNYYSELDAFLLRAGTTVAGTIDRQHGQAAGAIGFHEPSSLSEQDRALYRRKLHQISWSKEMIAYANWGGHIDWTNPPFVRQYLAPLIVGLNQGQFDDDTGPSNSLAGPTPPADEP